MKKLLAALLTILTAVSAFVIPMGASAKAKAPSTYTACDDIFTFGKGYVYVKTVYENEDYFNWYVFVDNKGKEKTLAKVTPLGSSYFYVAGDNFYYIDEGKTNNLLSVNISTKKIQTVWNNKKLSYLNLLGGYGSKAIVRDENNIYQIDNGKLKKLFSVPYKVKLFNGNLYYSNKRYSLAKGKSYETVEKKEMLVNKNYICYINKNDNLTIMNKKGVKENVDVKVDKLIGLNNGKTVIYTKNDNIYRKAAGGKKVKITDITTLAENSNTDKDVYKDYYVSKADLYGKTAVICLASDNDLGFVNILTMDINGNNINSIYSYLADGGDDVAYGFTRLKIIKNQVVFGDNDCFEGFGYKAVVLEG